MRPIRAIPEDAVYDEMNSPVGKLTLIASPKGLHAILWDIERSSETYKKNLKGLVKAGDHKIILQTQKQLMEYFAGQRKNFNLPLALNGTDFQIQAWKQLQKIPYGKTISYGEQAEKIGDKKKARAVGMANGCNPVSIVVPCHRVIGSNGKLVGFDGGLPYKQWLLEHEKAN